MRDKIGSFMSRSQCETFLNNWINNYTIGYDDAPAVLKAKNPLREARVDVVEVPGKPGCYRASLSAASLSIGRAFRFAAVGR